VPPQPRWCRGSGCELIASTADREVGRSFIESGCVGGFHRLASGISSGCCGWADWLEPQRVAES